MTSVRLDGAAAAFEKLGKQFPEAAKRGLLSAALRGVREIQTVIIPSRTPQPVDRGVYRAGWKVVPDADGSVSIENREPHAAFIEYGVRAANVKVGAAMLRALTEWVLRKGLAADIVEAQQVAWGIAKAAERRGFFKQTGLGVLQQLIDRNLRTYIQQEVEREIRRVLP